jgi:hypothetical protein
MNHAALQTKRPHETPSLASLPVFLTIVRFVSFVVTIFLTRTD